MTNVLCFDEFISSNLELQGVIKLIFVKNLDEVANKVLCEKIDGIIVRLGITLSNSFLSQFNSLQFIATITTGLDHIDAQYCDNNQVKVISLKGETTFLSNITATPEMTWALLLSLIRKIPSAYQSVKEGRWERTPFFGTELSGKQLGIIGFGRTGKIVGRYGYAFGMRVVAFEQENINFNDYPYSSQSLTTLLEKSDVISVHLPLNKDTHHFLTHEHFECMKSSAVFINTSRGAIVDENALLKALRQHKISGAAIDVIENETQANHINESHQLIAYAQKKDNLLISPHIAGSTNESMIKTADFIAKKIIYYLSEEK
jgi:D-3-phosphoglycerate dehydrogenase / 2-oxoglutarate reductase